MAISMMGRGASIDPQTLAQRQKMADLLYQNSLVPQTPERSWTQGMARMLQAANSGYEDAQIQKDRDLYKQQRVSDMQKLGVALGNGNYKDVIGQLSDPDAQMMAFGLAKSDMDSNNNFNQQMKLKDYDHGLKRQDKREDFAYQRMGAADDFQNTLTLEEGKQQANRDLEGVKSGYRMQEKRADPVKDAQSKINMYTQVLNDPDAPPEIKADAQSKLDAATKSVAAMKPPQSAVSVNMGNQGESQMEKNFGGKIGEESADIQLANIKAMNTATDQMANYQRIQDYITDGSLGPLSTTTFGQGLSKVAARLGQPNDSAAISDTVRTMSEQLVNMRQLLTRQGAISNYEQSLLKDIALKADDTLEATQAKLFLFQQLANRQKLIGDLTLQWKDRYGGIIRKGENGMSFDSAVKNLVERTPLVSYADYMKKKQDAASEANGA